MNNNICKWGNSHKQTLLEKAKNISKKLARKLIMSLLVTAGMFCTVNLQTAYASHSLENSRTGFSLTIDNSGSAGMSLTDSRSKQTISKYLDGKENILAQKAAVSQSRVNDKTSKPIAHARHIGNIAPQTVYAPAFKQSTPAVQNTASKLLSSAAASAVPSAAEPSSAAFPNKAKIQPAANHAAVSSSSFGTPVSEPVLQRSAKQQSGTGFSLTVDNSGSAGMSLTDSRSKQTVSKYLDGKEKNISPKSPHTQTQNAVSAAVTAQAQPLLSLPVTTAEAAAKPKTVFSPVFEQYSYNTAENNTENTPKTLEQEMLAQSLAEHNAAAADTADTAHISMNAADMNADLSTAGIRTASLTSSDTDVYAPALQSYQYALPAASQTDGGTAASQPELTPTTAMSAAPAFAPLAAPANSEPTPLIGTENNLPPDHPLGNLEAWDYTSDNRSQQINGGTIQGTVEFDNYYLENVILDDENYKKYTFKNSYIKGIDFKSSTIDQILIANSKLEGDFGKNSTLNIGYLNISNSIVSGITGLKTDILHVQNSVYWSNAAYPLAKSYQFMNVHLNSPSANNALIGGTYVRLYNITMEDNAILHIAPTVNSFGLNPYDPEHTSGVLAEEISFAKENSGTINLISYNIFGHNIVNENFTGNLYVSSHHKYTDRWGDITKIAGRGKKIDVEDASEINANNVTIYGYDSEDDIIRTSIEGYYQDKYAMVFSTDTWKDFANDMLIAGNIYLTHDETDNYADKFKVHEFNENTVIGKDLHFYFSPGYTIAERTLYEASRADIMDYASDSGKTNVMISVAGDKADKGFIFNGKDQILYLGEDFTYDFADPDAYRDTLTQDFTYKNAENNRLYTIKTEWDFDELQSGDKEVSYTMKINEIEIHEGGMYSLIGDIGDIDMATGTINYLKLKNGFTGKGGIRFMPETDEDGTIKSTEIYFGGNNTYTGATEIYSGVTVYLENKDSIANSKTLILHGGGHLFIDIANENMKQSFDNFDNVILMGVSNADPSEQTKTYIDGGGNTISLSGAGKQFNFFQDESVSRSGSSTPAPTPDTPATPDTPENTITADISPASPAGPAADPAADPDDLPPPLRHHSVTLLDVNVDILNGASLMVNYLGKTVGDNLDPSLHDNMNDIAVLVLGNGANVKIKGFDNGANASAHAYFGNGFVRLENGSSLSLEGGAGLHFSAHKDGFFEYPYDENGDKITTQDPHNHASIELNGGKLNLVLDDKSHLYSDHILSEDHKHNLIGATQYTPSGGGSPYTGNIAEDITFSLTAEALNRIDNIIPDNADETWAKENHLSLDQVQMLQEIKNSGNYTDLMSAVTNTGTPSTLSDLYTKFLTGKGETDSDANKQEFNDLLSTLVTVGMNNDVHGYGFQKYGVQFTDKGAYIYVLETLSVDDFIKNTGIKISIKNQVNEVLGDLSSASAEQADLLKTGTVTDKNSGAYKLINNALDAVNSYQTKEVAVAGARLLDSAAQVATVAGAQTLAWDMLQTRSDSLQRHLDSIKDIPDQKLNLWADMLYINNKSREMWTDVNGERDVTANLGGFIAGADYRFHDKAVAGASFAFMGGNAETTIGNSLGLDINNDTYSLAASAYAQYEIQPGLRIRGDLGIQHTENDIEMTAPALFNIKDKITADPGTNAVQAFAAVEKDFGLKNGVILTPYVGAKYTYLRTDGYTSKIGNKDAFKVDAADQHIVSVPVGVKVSKDIQLKNGKTVTPRAGIYVQPNFGDTEVTNRTQGVGLQNADTIRPDVIGTFSFGGNVGAEMELNERTSIALDYNYNGSDKSNNHNITASIVFKF